jgi:hypothetical protein
MVFIFINMRKLYVVLALLMSFVSTASHLAGGDIQYRYIGDSTGITRHYKVILRVYRDVTGIAMPTTDQVIVSSNCYANINVAMNLVPGSGVVAPTLFDCVVPGPTNKTLEVYMYVGYVILPGNCSTFRFWYENCCRPPGVTNINGSNGGGNDGFFFDALLDNATSGQNSSPVFTSEPVRAFCVGNPFTWKQTTIEEDGDSVVYSLINCRENAYPNQTNIPFDAGWSATQPVTSAYFNLDPATGLISFLPTQNEIDALSVLVEEYRFDSLYHSVAKLRTGVSRTKNIGCLPCCSVTTGKVLACLRKVGVKRSNAHFFCGRNCSGLTRLKASNAVNRKLFTKLGAISKLSGFAKQVQLNSFKFWCFADYLFSYFSHVLRLCSFVNSTALKHLHQLVHFSSALAAASTAHVTDGLSRENKLAV